MGLEQERARAIFPNILQRQLEPAVNATLETLLGKRRSHDVAAKSLELGAVVAVHELLGVEIAAQVLAQIDRYVPGLEAAVRVSDLATPLTFWQHARSWRGAFEGWSPTPEAILGHVKKVLPGLASLYLAGQWVEPGSGVPSALMSGRQVMQLLCADAGRPFVS